MQASAKALNLNSQQEALAQDSPHLQWLAVRCLADLAASPEAQLVEEGPEDHVRIFQLFEALLRFGGMWAVVYFAFFV